jgi:hypothetical protein
MGIPFLILYMAVSGIILALAYTLSPSQWKQSINHFFYIEEESK